MTHEALYYAFYYVTVRYTLATKQDPAFIQDQPQFEAIQYTTKKPKNKAVLSFQNILYTLLCGPW